jgi:uncharacterized Zn-finger protein
MKGGTGQQTQAHQSSLGSLPYSMFAPMMQSLQPYQSRAFVPASSLVSYLWSTPGARPSQATYNVFPIQHSAQIHFTAPSQQMVSLPQSYLSPSGWTVPQTLFHNGLLRNVDWQQPASCVPAAPAPAPLQYHPMPTHVLPQIQSVRHAAPQLVAQPPPPALPPSPATPKSASAQLGYPCLHESCNKRFSLKKSMQTHMKTHSGERPFICDFPNCGKSFAMAGVLRVHYRIHTGERPFKCTFKNCDKTFKDSGSRTKHMRTHTGERPFKCDQCGHGFTQSGHLARHLRTHEEAQAVRSRKRASEYFFFGIKLKQKLQEN